MMQMFIAFKEDNGSQSKEVLTYISCDAGKSVSPSCFMILFLSSESHPLYSDYVHYRSKYR